MGRVKGLGAVLGATVLLVVVAACGSGESSSQPTTPAVSHGGPVKDYISLVDNLRAAGATVDPAGTGSADFFAPQGQLLTVNGERVETFEFASAEEADAAADGVSASGSSISRVDADPGLGVASSVLWDMPPHFYKAGKLIVLYASGATVMLSMYSRRPWDPNSQGARVCHSAPIRFHQLLWRSARPWRRPKDPKSRSAEC